ncbi:MAG: NADH-quinone oxidoreductase subunit L [Candidatus Methanomethyliaceae archaeon]|nr:NADH-quinone oxidoreductase subunit L [Candidatus Methanomethyliaceae archaeon]
MELAPWLCWIMPTIGSISHYLLPKRMGRTRYLVTISFSFIAWIMALLTLGYIHEVREIHGIWFPLPDGRLLDIGVLLDPLSIVLANLVAFLSLLILIYSFKYMEGEPGENRYWFFMSLFIGGMLLLILANNFIFFFIGWKIVGLCSFGLIAHYYSDERKYWIGGPEPHPFQKPSRCGLKALWVTTLGDVALLASIIIIYVFSGTFNYMELYHSASSWMGEMSKIPGLLTITIVLFLCGPFAKSAQFPFHEWLPEAMAGPTPVSALIHAATMVKAGVYLVARVFPIFYLATWFIKIHEAMNFFMIVAFIGCFTAFLAGSQAMVAIELKKVLAYSTMSVIGYMMLGLGAAGLSPYALIEGFTSGIFHLINHGVFKAALFLCAGVLIHASGSIYITDMRFSSKEMKLTWLFMWIASLALIGVPPLSGFWSKDGILLSCLESGQYALFILATLTVSVTSFYVIRCMGIIFHRGIDSSNNSHKNHNSHISHDHEHHGEASPIMLIPYGILALITIFIGLIGPFMKEMLSELFSSNFKHLGLLKYGSPHHGATYLEFLTIAISIAMILLGAFPAYRAYIAYKLDVFSILNKYPIMRYFHKFLWNRWYMDAFFNKVFAESVLASREPTAKYIEGSMDLALNVGVPRLFSYINAGMRKLQTGILSVNMIYIISLFLALIMVMLLLGVG